MQLIYTCLNCKEQADGQLILSGEMKFCPSCGNKAVGDASTLSMGECEPCQERATVPGPIPMPSNPTDPEVTNFGRVYTPEETTTELEPASFKVTVGNHEEFGIPKVTTIDIEWAGAIMDEVEVKFWPEDQNGNKAPQWEPDLNYWKALKAAWVEGEVIHEKFPMSALRDIRRRMIEYDQSEKKNGNQSLDSWQNAEVGELISSGSVDGGGGLSNGTFPSSELSAPPTPENSAEILESSEEQSS